MTRYESEIRDSVTIKECDEEGGQHFYKTGRFMTLKEVILGMNYSGKITGVETLVERLGYKDVTVSRVTRSPSAFKMIPDHSAK